jgi:hypothetical protein
MFCTELLLVYRSRIVLERLPDNQVYYVLPVESILGKLPVVPVGDTGTISYCQCMWQHAEDFVGAVFDTREVAGDGSRWWYINT